MLFAGVWFILHGTSGRPDLVTGGLTGPPATEAVPPSPTLIMLRKALPKPGSRDNADDLAAMTAFYNAPAGALIWVTESGLSDKARAVIDEVRRADDWGLRSSDFTLPELTAAQASPQAAAEAEIKLTLAVLKYARYARGGRIRDPSRISKLFDHTPPVQPPALVLADLAATEAPDAYLRALHPKHGQFERLRQLLLKLRGAKGGELRADVGEREIVYGAKLQSAVPQLQRANTWDPDVKIESARADLNDQPTLEGENVGSTIDRILINMERWRWLPTDLGAFYVWDNVPEFLTRVVKNGQVIHTDEIIVGQPTWPTPVVLRRHEDRRVPSELGCSRRHQDRRSWRRSCARAPVRASSASSAAATRPRPCSTPTTCAPTSNGRQVDRQLRRLGQRRHSPVQLPAAARPQERARRREVHVPQLARRLHA